MRLAVKSVIAAASLATGLISAIPAASAAATHPARSYEHAQQATRSTIIWSPGPLYVSETGCLIAGEWGELWGNWQYYACVPQGVPGDNEPWYRLWTGRQI